MYAKFVFFTVIPVLLVPLGYSSFATNEACAAPREEGWGGPTCKLILDEERKACCWHEATGDLVCQICDADGTNCDPPIVDQESKGKLPGDLQDSLDVNPTPPTEPKVPREDILTGESLVETEDTTDDESNNDSVVPRNQANIKFGDITVEPEGPKDDVKNDTEVARKKAIGNPEYGDTTIADKDLGDQQNEDDEDDGPTINDPQTTSEPKVLDPGKIEIPNLK